MQQYSKECIVIKWGPWLGLPDWLSDDRWVGVYFNINNKSEDVYEHVNIYRNPIYIYG